MTMLPATQHELSKQEQRQQSCGGFGGGTVMSRLEVQGSYYFNQNICRESELLESDMGEDDQSRSNSASVGGCGSKGNNQINQQEQEKDEGWLQLSIGRRREGDELGGPSSLVELDLLPRSNSEPCRPLLRPPAPFHLSGSVTPLLNFNCPQPPPSQPSPPPPLPPSNLLFQQLQYPHSASGFAPHHSHSNWAFAPAGPFTMPSSSSSSFPLSSHHHPAASYFPMPFHFPRGFHDDTSASPSSDVRVVDPPRRPHSGIWFMLQASPDQAREPFLPQIPKSYLKIKDGKMTVRLLLKYLVNKLRLQSESEVSGSTLTLKIEIRCRGQQLGPLLTLEHVRDNIWSAMTPTLLPDFSTTDHIMVLYYETGSPCKTVRCFLGVIYGRMPKIVFLCSVCKRVISCINYPQQSLI